MAIFGTTKKKGEKKGGRISHARSRTPADAMEHDIIHAPWFSEKALIATEKGVYAFVVPARATKTDIAGAIKAIYKISPKKIRIVNLPAKRKALRTRRGTGVRSARRKAYVYVNTGDSIPLS